MCVLGLVMTFSHTHKLGIFLGSSFLWPPCESDESLANSDTVAGRNIHLEIECFAAESQEDQYLFISLADLISLHPKIRVCCQACNKLSRTSLMFLTSINSIN